MPLRTAALALAVAFALPAPADAQAVPPVPREKEPPTRIRLREQRVPFTVTGCVRGSRLRLTPLAYDATSDILGTEELVLEGSKDMLRQLRSGHEGHEEEVTGIAILTVTDDNSTIDIEQKPVGKQGRITVGARQGQGATATLRRPVRFRVTSVRHLHESCAPL